MPLKVDISARYNRRTTQAQAKQKIIFILCFNKSFAYDIFYDHLPFLFGVSVFLSVHVCMFNVHVVCSEFYKHLNG